jgi:hypothetical protein
MPIVAATTATTAMSPRRGSAERTLERSVVPWK